MEDVHPPFPIDPQGLVALKCLSAIRFFRFSDLTDGADNFRLPGRSLPDEPPDDGLNMELGTIAFHDKITRPLTHGFHYQQPP